MGRLATDKVEICLWIRKSSSTCVRFDFLGFLSRTWMAVLVLANGSLVCERGLWLFYDQALGDLMRG